MFVSLFLHMSKLILTTFPCQTEATEHYIWASSHYPSSACSSAGSTSARFLAAAAAAPSPRVNNAEHFPPDQDKITAHYRLHSVWKKENLLHIYTANQHGLSGCGGGVLLAAVEERGFPVQTLNGTR